VLRVSVVVSTYQRADRLARLLGALRQQSIPYDDFEIVVVDDGSGPATGEVLRTERQRGTLTLTLVRHEQRRGPAAGRNAGWRVATAPLVAFTDDDCVPSPWWLEELLTVAGGSPGSVVQGQTRPEPAGLAATGDRQLSVRTVIVTAADGRFETCNILYPRKLLDLLGGFDEGYGNRPAGEDTDLGWRALELGVAVVFAPDALVHHDVVRLGLRGQLRDVTRWGVCAKVFARHPQARTILYHHYFWNVWHYLLLRSLLVLVLPVPDSVRRLILGRHLRALTERSRTLGADWWAVPYLLVQDAVETAAIVGGAARYRTPVL
jgi:GT2 family glycosyltransferase